MLWISPGLGRNPVDNKECNSEVVSNVRLKATKGAAVPAGPTQAWINTVELPVSSVMLTGAMPAGMGTPTRTPRQGHPTSSKSGSVWYWKAG